MSEYVSEYFPLFGVSSFHNEGYWGRGKQIPGQSVTGTPVKLYIIDTGFNPENAGEIGTSKFNPDLSNVIVDKFSADAISPPYPAHGDLTCALVAAQKNGWGIVGVCPDATIYLGDVDDAQYDIYDFAMTSAIESAISKDVDIISMSLGSETPSDNVRTAINKARAKGILVFASTGNSGKDEEMYPASLPGVISVASCNTRRQPSSFNTRNSHIALYAPGEQYYLPTTRGGVRVNGTSFACPFAAGLAALYLGKKRYLLNDPTYRISSETIIPILKTYLSGETYIEPIDTVVDGNGDNNTNANIPPIPTADNSILLHPILIGACAGAILGTMLYSWVRDMTKKQQDPTNTQAV